MNNLFDLTGKTALITGGGGLLGPKHAEAIVEYGGKVILTDWHEDRAKEKAERIGENVTYHYMDVTDKESIEAVVEQYDKIDILINNVGGGGRWGKENIEQTSPEVWKEVHQKNAGAAIIFTRRAIPLMRKNKWGRVVNITSTTASLGNRGQANYAAAKSGVEAFSRSLSKEVGSRGITVNSVAPGYIETDMTADIKEEVKKEILKQIPLLRFGQPDEVAEVVSFLSSDKSSYITGQTIHINGGMYMV